MTPPTATSAATDHFPADIDPRAITEADLPADGYGELAEIDEFEEEILDWRAGRIDDEVFRAKRLFMGTYGIRQSDDHMLRIKAPLGKFNARQYEAMAVISERWSRGFGHITTRQNFQFHFVKLDDVPDAMRVIAASGLTMREACGNAVRNVTMSPLAGVHPDEPLDVEAAADEVVRHCLRHPAFQVLPRKFKIAFAADPSDDAGTGFHDIGVLPRVTDSGEVGYKIVLGGGLGSAPQEAVALEDFTPAALLLPTVQAAIELFAEKGDYDNRVRARMKFLVKRMGREAFVAEVLERRQAAIEAGILSSVLPEPAAPTATEVDFPTDLPLELADRDRGAYRRWLRSNVLRQRQRDRAAVYVSLHLGDLTTEQFRGIAELMRDNGIVDSRLTIRQNIVLRDVEPFRLPNVWAALAELGMDRALAEKSGDVVSCPGAETCNLAITASRGLGEALTDRLVDEQLHEVADVSINISGCPNSCGQHQAFDIGFSGMARRDIDGNEGPGYRVFVGAHIEDGGAKFGDYVAKVPALHAPDAAARLIRAFVDQRADAQEPFWVWADRTGRQGLSDLLKDLDTKATLAENPEYFQDFGSSDAFEVILGRSECA